MASLLLEHIKKNYGKVEVVKDLDISIDDGEFLTLVGPSGCGKSTTLRMLAGLEEITGGTLKIGDIIANDLPSKSRKIAMVFQSYALFPHMSVEANVLFGLKIKKKKEEFKREKLKWVMELVGLTGLEKRYPKELSGGQRQRVALARALVLDPEILLLDEPLSNLDAKLRVKMRTEIKKIHKQLKYTIVYVTHDQTEAMTLSDRIAIMHEGILMQIGSPYDVYNYPRNIFVAGFIGSPIMNFVNGELKKENSTLYFTKEGLKIKILPKLEKKIIRDSQNVILGIRPEDIHIKKHSSADLHQFESYKSMINVVEPLGSSDILDLSCEGSNLTVLGNAEDKNKPDDEAEIIIDLNKIHLFDSVSNKSLFYD